MDSSEFVRRLKAVEQGLANLQTAQGFQSVDQKENVSDDSSQQSLQLKSQLNVMHKGLLRELIETRNYIINDTAEIYACLVFVVVVVFAVGAWILYTLLESAINRSRAGALTRQETALLLRSAALLIDKYESPTQCAKDVERIEKTTDASVVSA